MRLLTFAAGLAAGYVLGTRAGREKYEQIVDKTRQLRAHPTVERAAQKVSSTMSQSDPAMSRVDVSAPGVDESVPSSGRKASVRGRSVSTPANYTDPLA